MKITDVKIGLRVVRSKGDYVVGRTGSVVNIDEAKQRAQVDWDRETTTWVSVKSIEAESIPYQIITYNEKKFQNKKTGRFPYPKYQPK